MNTTFANWIKMHQLVSFFCLTYLIMFTVVLAAIYLSPAAPMPQWSLVWFLSIFSPGLSALIVSWIIGGWAEVKGLLSGFTRWKVGFRWYLATLYLFLGPLTVALIYIALGNPFPGAKPGFTIMAMISQLIFNVFSGPLSEEAGWRGFALPRLQGKFNALVSSLILGTIWACWHIPLYFVPGSSQQGIPFPIYVALNITFALYITWLYNNTQGSLIITVLAHFCINIASGLIVGTLGLLPTMVFYMTVAPLLVVSLVLIIIYFRPTYFSRKPVSELPFQR